MQPGGETRGVHAPRVKSQVGRSKPACLCEDDADGVRTRGCGDWLLTGATGVRAVDGGAASEHENQERECFPKAYRQNPWAEEDRTASASVAAAFLAEPFD